MTRVDKMLAHVPSSQAERLAFIEARLYFLGELQRQDVVKRFSIASVQASRDLSLYKQLAPKNLSYDYRGRTYEPSDKFKRIFNLSAENLLWWLKSGLGDGLPHPQGFPTESVIALCVPDADMLAQVTRATYRNRVLEITYLSLFGGAKKRLIVPHALVDSGKRWHVRAFDRDYNRFSDFVINRIQAAQVLEVEFSKHEQAIADTQWNRQITLVLVPHPQIMHKAAIEADYLMKNGQIQVKCRAAIAGYMLRHWGVDCSAANTLNPEEYRLALHNTDSLTGVESADLAPGHKKTKEQS